MHMDKIDIIFMMLIIICILYELRKYKKKIELLELDIQNLKVRYELLKQKVNVEKDTD